MEVKPGYRQTEVGVVPEDWTLCSLLDLAQRSKERFDDGDWVEAEYLTSTGVRLVQTGNIGLGQFVDKDSKKYISSDSFVKLRCKDLYVGDILICRLAEPAGRACILPDLGEERVITAVDVTIFRPPAEVADRKYLVSVFSTSEWFRAVRDRCGGSTRTRISRGELGKISVCLPPVPEQRALAAALSDVDALLGELDRLIAKKRDLKLAAMQQLLTAQTRLHPFHGEWEVKRLGDICEIAIGRTPPRLNQSMWGDGYPWLSIADLHSKVVSDSKEQITALAAASMAIVPKGTLLMSFKLSIGRVCFAGCDLFTNEAICSFNGLRASAEFLYYVLGRTNFSHYGKQAVKGYTLNKESLNQIEVSLPPDDEQSAIAAVLAGMDAELAALEARRDKTRALKQGMLHELLTGRTRLVPAEVADA